MPTMMGLERGFKWLEPTSAQHHSCPNVPKPRVVAMRVCRPHRGFQLVGIASILTALLVAVGASARPADDVAIRVALAVSGGFLQETKSWI